jgi:hypothetical protein
MQFSPPRFRRALAATLLVVAALASPGGAFAESFDPALLLSPDASPEAYIRTQADSYVIFGDGVAGQRLPDGDAVSAGYQYGQGAAGNLSSMWSTDLFSCLFWNC